FSKSPTKNACLLGETPDGICRMPTSTQLSTLSTSLPFAFKDRALPVAKRLVQREIRDPAPFKSLAWDDSQIKSACDGERDRDVEVRRLAKSLTFRSALFHVHRHDYAEIVNH